MTSFNYEQGSAEWFQARCGRITASRIADVMGKLKSGSYSSKRDDYLWELVEERLTGAPNSRFVTAAMQHGIDTEPEAKEFFSGAYDCEILPVGFVAHPDMDFAGASPDGLIGVEGIVEVKCPTTKVMLQTIKSNVPDQRYVLQVQWQMACLKSNYAWIVYYDNRLPLEMRMKRFLVERNDDLITEIESEVAAFNSLINETILSLKESGNE